MLLEFLPLFQLSRSQGVGRLDIKALDKEIEKLVDGRERLVRQEERLDETWVYTSMVQRKSDVLMNYEPPVSCVVRRSTKAGTVAAWTLPSASMSRWFSGFMLAAA